MVDLKAKNFGYYIEFYRNIVEGSHHLNLEKIASMLEYEKDDWMLWYILGYTLYDAGEYLEAIKAFKNALELNKDFHLASFFLEQSVLMHIVNFLDNRFIDEGDLLDVLNFVGENLSRMSIRIEDIFDRPFGAIDLRKIDSMVLKAYTSIPESFIYGGLSMINLFKTINLIINGEFDDAVEVTKYGLRYCYDALSKSKDEDYRKMMERFHELFFDVLKIAFKRGFNKTEMINDYVELFNELAR